MEYDDDKYVVLRYQGDDNDDDQDVDDVKTKKKSPHCVDRHVSVCLSRYV